MDTTFAPRWLGRLVSSRTYTATCALPAVTGSTPARSHITRYSAGPVPADARTDPGPGLPGGDGCPCRTPPHRSPRGTLCLVPERFVEAAGWWSRHSINQGVTTPRQVWPATAA